MSLSLFFRTFFAYTIFLMLMPMLCQAQERPIERLYTDVNAAVGMAFDNTGALFVAEWSRGRVTRFSADGQRTVFADGLSGPSGLAIHGDGSLYVASYSSDLIYRFTAQGERSVFITGLATPAGLSFDRSGQFLIANRRTNQILTITDSETLKPVISTLQTPVGAVQTPNGGYVVSNIGGGITVLRPDGTRFEAGKAFKTPGPGITMTKEGRVFVVDYGGTTIQEILPNATSRIIADGLSSPVGLTVSPDEKYLLTATWGDNAIYRIPLKDESEAR